LAPAAATAAALYCCGDAGRCWLRREFVASEVVFLAAVAYGLVWKLAFPQIVESYDQLSECISSPTTSGRAAAAGRRLAALAAARLLLHPAAHAAALLGRLAGLGPGASFNVAIVLLCALVITLAWEFVAAIGVRFRAGCWRSLPVVGGTGVAPLFHLITAPWPADLSNAGVAEHVIRYNSSSSAGSRTAWPRRCGDGWPAPGRPLAVPQLPAETFVQQFVLGGYHARSPAFCCCSSRLPSIADLQRDGAKARPALEFVLGLTVPLTLCANAWTFPFQALLVAG